MATRRTMSGSVTSGVYLHDAYSGDWEESNTSPGLVVKSGNGVYRYANTCFVYEGTFVDGYKQGYGRLVMNDGGYIEGKLNNGNFNGACYRVWPCGAWYSGEMHNGERDGTGTLVQHDGSMYSGEWKSNMRHGKGKHLSGQTPLRITYEGDFYHNRMTGSGTIVWWYKSSQESNNAALYDMYTGPVKDGKRNGNDGLLTLASGDWYRGDWHADKPHGHGQKYSIATGIMFNGQFSNGLPTSAATMLCLGNVDVSIIKKGIKPGDTLPEISVFGCRYPTGCDDVRRPSLSAAIEGQAAQSKNTTQKSNKRGRQAQSQMHGKGDKKSDQQHQKKGQNATDATPGQVTEIPTDCVLACEESNRRIALRIFGSSSVVDPQQQAVATAAEVAWLGEVFTTQGEAHIQPIELPGKLSAGTYQLAFIDETPLAEPRCTLARCVFKVS